MNTSILNTLQEAAIDRLSERLITDTPDSTQAGLIREGLLQDDPTDTQINLLIHPGDKDWKHELYVTQHGISSPYYEIGGGSTWMRRFTVEFQLFFDGEDDRSVARTKAHVVLSRAEHALKTMTVPADQDDFGEAGFLIQVRDSYLEESGGEGTFIWRGEIRIEFMTEKYE